VAVAIVALPLAIGGWNADALQLAARYTARFAFLVFLPVYVASSLHRLSPSPRTRSLMRARRSLGLVFAAAHGVHLAALTAYQIVAAQVPDPPTLVVGGGAFGMMFAMAATSTDAAVRRLGRHWRRLHRIGIHWLWLVFTFSYIGRVADGRLAFVPLLALALGALGLRLAAWRSRLGARTPATSEVT
jgi:DMSO/TMAO reductase YedYZ heme-binding membrane subunit